MVERLADLLLALEAGVERRVALELHQRHFDGHNLAESLVTRSVNNAHSSLANFALDDVAS